MKGFGEKVTDFVTSVLGAILGAIFLFGIFVVPVGVIIWAVETISNFLR